MPNLVVKLEAHLLDRRAKWCDECFTSGITEVDVAVVDSTTLRVLQRFTARTDCRCQS